MLSALLAGAIALLAVIMYLPQTLRIVRGRNIDGVSLTGMTNSVLSSIAWIVFLVQLGDWMMAFATLAPTLLIVVALISGLRQGGRLQQAYFPALWGLTLGGAYLLGAPYFAVVLSLSIVLFYGPAALHAWQSNSTRGVSVVSWSLAFCEAALSVGYGVLEGNTALWVYGLLGSLGAGLVVAAVLVDRRKATREKSTEAQHEYATDVGAMA